MRHTVNVCYDVDGWAWHRRALDLVEFAPPEFRVNIYSQATRSIHNHPENLLYLSWFDCPVQIASRTVTMLANPGVQHARWNGRDPNRNPWIACGTSKARNRDNARERFPLFKRIICLTPELEAITKSLGGTAICIPTGINHRVFQPRAEIGEKLKLRVGWCGQVDPEDPYNQKGYKWIAEPVFRRCEDFCEFVVNTKNYRSALTREEMVDWYNSIDVFLCTSICEGTPTTAMEAMMCGRPVVTTPVGDMPNIVSDTVNGYLVEGYHDEESAARTIDAICDRLLLLHICRDSLRRQGKDARQRMLEIRNWETLASQWLQAIIA